MRRKPFQSLGAWLATLVLSVTLANSGLSLVACAPKEADATPDYRYRLTVEVETPEGPRTGSSVIEVRQSMGSTAMSGFGKRIDRRVRGEAVAVDLPGGRTLYALLRSDDNIDWASYVMPMLAPKIEGEAWEDEFDNVLLIKGTVQLPRTWPAQGQLSRGSAYPMLVTFANERDPTSITRVGPDDLSASFGQGVKLRRITVEMTQDPVTNGIEKRLTWLPEHSVGMLDGNTINTIRAKNRLANDLSQADFTRGNLP